MNFFEAELSMIDEALYMHVPVSMQEKIFSEFLLWNCQKLIDSENRHLVVDLAEQINDIINEDPVDPNLLQRSKQRRKRYVEVKVREYENIVSARMCVEASIKSIEAANQSMKIVRKNLLEEETQGIHDDLEILLESFEQREDDANLKMDVAHILFKGKSHFEYHYRAGVSCDEVREKITSLFYKFHKGELIFQKIESCRKEK